jgi:RNA polymerase sigma-B factor
MGPISSAVQHDRAILTSGQGGDPPAADAAVPLRQADRPCPAGPEWDPARQREEFIAKHMPMAARIARTFAGRGEDLDDLTQVAMLELVSAAARFDSARGPTFTQYAYPCILGALKKHFRDNGWSLHVSRRMQELHLQTSRAVPVLTQILGRAPSVSDVALYLHLSDKDTREGLSTSVAYQSQSLNRPARDCNGSELLQLLGGLDDQLEAVPDRHALGEYLARLSPRERDVLYLRFTRDQSQREIGEQLGVSQMQVSRLLSRSLASLRMAIAGPSTTPAP